jgi:hypothetical protein
MGGHRLPLPRLFCFVFVFLFFFGFCVRRDHEHMVRTFHLKARELIHTPAPLPSLLDRSFISDLPGSRHFMAVRRKKKPVCVCVFNLQSL